MPNQKPAVGKRDPRSASVLLADNGRCCGRKPLVYKSAWSTSTGPHRYCPRCDRAYHLEENEQIPNWAWKLVGQEWARNAEVIHRA